jgi:hypothetical protein
MKYITLMSSLPHLGNLFGKKQVPISRLKLTSRLKMLSEKDAILLNQIASLIAWQQQPMERTDAEFVKEAKQFFQELRNPTLRNIIEYRLDLRTIIAALRHRHRGENNPPSDQLWGIGRWVNYIERHWSEPGFHLEGMFPWVLEANRLLNANDSVALERLQFEINWKMLAQLGSGHYFDFEAVVIYLMRWSLVDRWSRYEGETAVKRFRTLVDSGMEKFTDVFAQEVS